MDSVDTMGVELTKSGNAMANINVRAIPDQTKEALRVRAAKAGMSLEAFARRVLLKASMDNGDEAKAILDLAEKYFGEQQGVELDLPARATHREVVELGER